MSDNCAMLNRVSVNLDDIRTDLARAVHDGPALRKVLEKIARYCKVPLAQFGVIHANGVYLQSAFSDAVDDDLLNADYQTRPDQFRRLAVREMETGRAIRDSDLIAAAGLDADQTYEKLAELRELAHFAAIATARIEHLGAGFAVYAPPESGPISDESARRLEEVNAACTLIIETVLVGIIHESKYALRMASPLGAAAALDHRGHIVDYNDGFSDLLKRGAVALQRSWRPVIGDADVQSNLSKALSAYSEGGLPRFLAGIGDHAKTLICTLAPCSTRPLLGIDHGYLLLFFDEVSQPRRLNQRLARDYFNLTEAEAEIAGLIFDGISTEAISEARGTALSTTRTLLKRILAKTDCRRQAELVSRLVPFSERGQLDTQWDKAPSAD